MKNPFTCKTLKTNFPRIIVDALSKYEKVPNRKEVITDTMSEYIDKVAASSSSDDDLISTLKDWFAWGHYSGPWRGEWCQTNQTRFDVVENGPAAEARALIASDVCFYTSTGREVDIDGPFESVAYYATVEWRWQKNQDNGEIVKYFVNDKCLSWCPVLALWRIKLRARHLNVQPDE